MADGSTGGHRRAGAGTSASEALDLAGVRAAVARLQASYEALGQLIDRAAGEQGAGPGGWSSAAIPAAGRRAAPVRGLRIDRSLALIITGAVLVLVALIVGNL